MGGAGPGGGLPGSGLNVREAKFPSAPEVWGDELKRVPIAGRDRAHEPRAARKRYAQGQVRLDGGNLLAANANPARVSRLQGDFLRVDPFDRPSKAVAGFQENLICGGGAGENEEKSQENQTDRPSEIASPQHAIRPRGRTPRKASDSATGFRLTAPLALAIRAIGKPNVSGRQSMA